MKVSTLARVLGLPDDADQATCHAKIEELKAPRRRGASLDETRGAVARLQVKFGIDPPKAELERLIAQRIGPDSFLLNGNVLTGEEVQAAMQEEYEEAHALDDVLDESIKG